VVDISHRTHVAAVVTTGCSLLAVRAATFNIPTGETVVGHWGWAVLSGGALIADANDSLEIIGEGPAGE
jgi:hypothetical protein